MARQKHARRSRSRQRSKAQAAQRARRKERTLSVETPTREATGAARPRRQSSSASTYGQRPPSPFGGLPVAEIAILAGAIVVLVGLWRASGEAFMAGSVICGLGVLEFATREHFSGYRSHSALLAGMLAVVTEAVLGLSVPLKQKLWLLVVVIPVFCGVFWVLRKRFKAARQRRVRSLPAP